MKQNKLKILLITARADIGGGPEHVYRIIENLHEKIDFFIACPDNKPYRERYAEFIPEKRFFLLPHRKFTPAALIRLFGFISDNNIDIIHSHGKGAGIYSRPAAIFTRRRCIHTFHGFHVGQYSEFQKKLYVILERLMGVFTRHIIAVSGNEKNILLDHRIAPPKKIRLILNGVHIPEEMISRDNFSHPPFRLIHISRFDYAKNSLSAIRIFKRVLDKGERNLRLVIAGDGPDKHDAEKLSLRMEIAHKIDFCGIVYELKDYYLSSSLFLITSRWEALPLSLLEAMSYGLPAVASNVTGNRDAVEHGKTGMLYDPPDEAGAAEMILNIIDDREKWEEMSLKARKKAENEFGVDAMCGEIYSLYIGD